AACRDYVPKRSVRCGSPLRVNRGSSAEPPPVRSSSSCPPLGQRDEYPLSVTLLLCRGEAEQVASMSMREERNTSSPEIESVETGVFGYDRLRCGGCHGIRPALSVSQSHGDPCRALDVSGHPATALRCGPVQRDP